MGWSCSNFANFRLDAISKACIDQQNNQNTFISNGKKYFFEVSRREHHDGSVTGTVYRWIDNNRVKPSGSFKIKSNGEIERGPSWMKKIPAVMIRVYDSEHSCYDSHGMNKIPTQQDLIDLRNLMELNHHKYNKTPFVVEKIQAIDLDDNQVVAEYMENSLVVQG